MFWKPLDPKLILLLFTPSTHSTCSNALSHLNKSLKNFYTDHTVYWSFLQSEIEKVCVLRGEDEHQTQHDIIDL